MLVFYGYIELLEQNISIYFTLFAFELYECLFLSCLIPSCLMVLEFELCLTLSLFTVFWTWLILHLILFFFTVSLSFVQCWNNQNAMSCKWIYHWEVFMLNTHLQTIYRYVLFACSSWIQIYFISYLCTEMSGVVLLKFNDLMIH